MTAPKVPNYLQRIARLPRVFARIAESAHGVPLRELAAEFGTTEDELREDLFAFYTAGLDDLFRPYVLEFVGHEDDVEPESATIVRIAEHADLGVELVSPGDLMRLHAAAGALLEAEPDNEPLAEAIAVLQDTMAGAEAPEPTAGAGVLPLLQDAREQSRRVRVVYSREWVPGVRERVIEPYRLVQTQRGWEVDAGTEEGQLRTYLLSNIREAELLDETFEPPAGLGPQLEAQRATTRVRLRLPQHARWAADFHAESVEIVDEDDETFTADLDLLPPVEGRVGLLMLTGGGDTAVLTKGYLQAGVGFARQLLDHHRHD